MKLSKTYKRKRHSVSLLHAHLVFNIKYRRKVLTPKVFQIIKTSIQKSAKKLGITLEALECDKNHLHILFCYPPNLALSKIVQHFKGASSRLVRKAKLPDIARKLWGKAFWSPSYFVVSCGGAPLDIVKTYVDTQQTRPHNLPMKRKWPAKPAREARSASLPKALHPRTEVRGFRLDSG